MVKEIELKLDLGSFSNYLKLMGFLGQVESETHQKNAFFDTEERKLRASGWALRVRAEDERGFVTVKGVSTQVGGALVRDEFEAEISRSEAINCMALTTDIMSMGVAPIDFVKHQVGHVPVMILVKFDNVRQIKTVRLGDYDYRFEVDKTEFGDGSVDYELEVEVPETSHIEVVGDGIRRIFSSLDIPYEPQGEGKFSRALQRAGIK